jgi:RNA polymerase sigma-70 factor (ECF subfamily)
VTEHGGAPGEGRGAPQERSDEQVLAIFRDIDRPRRDREAAFHELVSRYHRRLFAVCVRVLGSADDAEDAVQETFVKLARHAEGFRGDAQLSTWLYRVARNVCLDRLRYERRRPSTPVDDLTTTGHEPSEGDGVDARIETMAVRDALAQLDERSRQLLLLVTVDGLSYAEAAEVVDLPIGTIKSRVSRARVRLGELLAAEPDDDELPRRPTTGSSERPPETGATSPRGPPGPAA